MAKIVPAFSIICTTLRRETKQNIRVASPVTVIVSGHLKVYEYTSIFSAIFSKGDNFHDVLFAYLEEEIFKRWDLLLKDRICCDGRKFFPL